VTSLNPAVNGEHEKSVAALSSVVAAIGLTSFKIIVGVATGSLGILAEAAHSGLDLVAALVTFFAVRLSGKPADKDHLYGHGKIENLSALFETLLLLLTCVWIIYEAVQRLFFKSVLVEMSIWSFIVMGTSIVIDYTRSRVLDRAAKKYNSQALEADALHFSTDIWSSTVVIVGLVFVWISEQFTGLAFLKQADSVAALGVALIVIYISVQLGIRTVHGLLDTAPAGKVEQITAAISALPGVVDCHHVRLRYSGPNLFIDAHVLVDGMQTLDEAHAITQVIERTVHEIAPDADITVHPEPANLPRKDDQLKQQIVSAVQGLPGILDCHHVRVRYSGPDIIIDVHVLADGELSLNNAHSLTEQVEQAILQVVPGADITVHAEPTNPHENPDQITEQIVSAVEALPGIQNCHNVRVRYSGPDIIIDVHVLADGQLSLNSVHSLTEQVEQAILQVVPDSDITVHAEPAG
jgi:cation diffusion facilitator family transporter